MKVIVSASRSPPGQVPKKLEFGSSFSQSGGSLVPFLANFRSLEALWERWGPIFDAQKRFGPPKVPQEAAPPKSTNFWGPIWELFFVHLLVCWALFLSIVFLLSSGTEFSWILAVF